MRAVTIDRPDTPPALRDDLPAPAPAEITPAEIADATTAE